MEGLTRLVSESLARHGFDRPLDYRRLHWSRWFRCESPHSLLLVPSKPGVFALAEEIMDFGLGRDDDAGNAHVGTAASAVQPARSAAESESNLGKRLDLADASTIPTPRRMLAVSQFYEEDDMAFVLDRMLSQQNPMRARLASGRFFVRFVVVEDQAQRRSICSALNQWIVSSAEKASGIGADFASSLELTPATEYTPRPNDAQQSLFEIVDARVADSVGRALLPATADSSSNSQQVGEARTRHTPHATAPQLDSGAATNIHCPSPFPSGF